MKERFFEVRLVKSPVGKPRTHREILRGMGLRRIGNTKILPDTPSSRGMIFKMSHMIDVRRFDSQSEYDKYREESLGYRELPLIIEPPKGDAVKKEIKTPASKKGEPKKAAVRAKAKTAKKAKAPKKAGSRATKTKK